MTLSVLVHGAKGKMGSISCKTVDAATDLQLVAGTGREDDLAQALAQYQPDVVVDFTLPNCVFENTKTIIASGAHPVIGTSGLNMDQIHELETLCRNKKHGGIIAPNFSIAAVLMTKAAAMIAPHLPDCEIIEAHHTAKVDSPSGTAQKTAEIIASHRNQTPDLLDKTRGKLQSGIPIHSIRLPGFFATEEIIFGQAGETLSITHRAHDRAAMMPGLLLSIRKVIDLDYLVYGLEHIIT